MDLSENHPGERVSWLKTVINISLRKRLLEKKRGVRGTRGACPSHAPFFLAPITSKRRLYYYLLL